MSIPQTFMKRLSRFKTINPTILKIGEFEKEKVVRFDSDIEWLNNNPIKIFKEDDYFSFELEDRAHKRAELANAELDAAFSKIFLIGDLNKYSCLKFGLQQTQHPLEERKITGKLNSLLEGTASDFDNKFLRLVQPFKKGSSKCGNFTGAIDLNTDQGVMYGVGVLRIVIDDLEFDILRISTRSLNKKEDKELIVIDSTTKIDLTRFQQITDSFFKAYSYIFGTLCGGSSYIVASNTEEFIKINRILFSRKPEEQSHGDYIFDSMEIREGKFLNSYFLFPSEVLTNMCTKILTEEKFERTLRIMHEANMNNYSLSTAILYSSALESISSLIPINKITTDAIDKARFEKSEILNQIIEVIKNNKYLNHSDKDFLLTKKMGNLNKPTNTNKLEAPFKYYSICLPEKFRKALKYRDKYLHGSIPKGNKLGSFRDDDINRSLELQFVVNILILKYVGYSGFLKNRSIEMEYYTQKSQGKTDDEIILDQSLYYKI